TQASVDRALDVLRSAPPWWRVKTARTDLRGDDGLVAVWGECGAEELLRGAAAVDLGRVEHVDASVERGVNHGRRLLGIDARPEVVATQARDRHLYRSDRAHRSHRSGHPAGWKDGRTRRTRRPF